MKKKSSLLFCFFVMLNVAFAQNAQNAYYDAVALRKYLRANGDFGLGKDSTAVYIPILARYLPESITSQGEVTQDVVGIFFDSTNLFLKDKNLASLPAEASSAISTLVSSIGGLDVTAFADGLAQFLVERTKEELNANFFKKFKDLLEEYPELKRLFPNTAVFIDSFEAWDYSNLLNTLREAFDKDCKIVLSSVVSLKDLKIEECKTSETCKERVQPLIDYLHSDDGIILITAFQIGDGMVQQKKLPDILNSVAAPGFLMNISVGSENANLNYRNSLILTNIMSMALKSNESSRHFITRDEFQKLSSDTELQNLFFALIWQQISNHKITIGNVVLADKIKPGTIDGVKKYLSQLVEEGENLNTAYKRLLNNRADGKDIRDDLGVVFEMSQRTLIAATNVKLIDTQINLPANATQFLSIANDVLQVAHDVAVRNYNAVVVGVLKIFSDHIQKSAISEDKKAELSQFTTMYLKYGSFAANVVNSPSPEGVKEAIKTVSLPSGSAAVKKHSNFNISLNAYVGFVYGNDKPNEDTYTYTNSSGVVDTVELNGGRTIGVYAPVGVGLNWGLGWQRKNPWSLSAFFSLIDVGALVGYHFSGDSTISQDMEVKLSNIFAPGANLIVGLPNVPISIGGGAQWIPTLQRNPGSNDLYNIDHSGIRWQVFVAVDIPMINFHTGRKTMLEGGKSKLYAKQREKEKRERKAKRKSDVEG